ALDYVVVKAPRWDLQKFRLVSKRLGSGMKSVGEVMAIGRSFEEAFQKALRMLDIGVSGLVGNAGKFQFRDLESELRDPSHERVFAIPEAIKRGYPIQRIHDLSHIDLWFLQKIEHIVNLERRIRAASRTGCSVEFDWCSVNAVKTLRELGYHTVIVNCNPETVSTDYNECDTLYFEELSLESILGICSKERPLGVIVAVGGQVPNNLAFPLHESGIRILGTPVDSIDAAEDRHRFSRLLDQLGIAQPEWTEAVSLQ